LENAYKLSTPADNAEYDDAFASTYDTIFPNALGSVNPGLALFKVAGLLTS